MQEGPASQDQPDVNLRFELRAYEDTDACRLASIITDVGADVVDRGELRDRWAERYPRHRQKTGGNRIGSRISRTLTLLRVAGIIEFDGDSVTVVNRERMAMSAANRSIVEGTDGVAIRPGLWSARPAAPDHLRGVQDVLEATRTTTSQE